MSFSLDHIGIAVKSLASAKAVYEKLGLPIAGRVITVQFNESLDPSTVNLNNFLVIRAGGVNNSFGQPSDVRITSDPRTQISYNALTNVVTIDLSRLDQSQLPASHDPVYSEAWKRTGGAADQLDRTIKRWRSQGR